MIILILIFITFPIEMEMNVGFNSKTLLPRKRKERKSQKLLSPIHTLESVDFLKKKEGYILEFFVMEFIRSLWGKVDPHHPAAMSQ